MALIFGPRTLSPTFCQKLDAVHVDDVADVVSCRESSRDVNAIIVPAQQKVFAKVEPLFFAMAGEFTWESHTQSSSLGRYQEVPS